MSDPDFAVALMAGGRSTRMGQDKALLKDPGGRELWQNQWNLLQQMQAVEEFISCRPDQAYFKDSHARLVFDAWPDAGPMGGIVSCLEAMQSSRLLVLAVDLPNLPPLLLRQLLETSARPASSMENPPSAIRGAVWRCNHQLEPLCAVYPREVAADGRRRIASGNHSLQQWILCNPDLFQIMEAPADFSDFFLNLNDPDTWEKWVTHQEGTGRASSGTSA